MFRSLIYKSTKTKNIKLISNEVLPNKRMVKFIFNKLKKKRERNEIEWEYFYGC